MREILLGIQQVPQPSPAKNNGGDCFACSLTAAFRHLFPETEIDFDKIWGAFTTTYYKSEKTCTDNTWSGLERATRAVANQYDLRIEVDHDILIPRFRPDTWSHAWFSYAPQGEWTEAVERYLRSGYVILTEINFAGVGPVSRGEGGRLYFNGTNHIVVVDGARQIWEKFEDGQGSSLNYYVHVVCSSKGAYWIRTLDFLKDHGAAGWFLLRRGVDRE